MTRILSRIVLVVFACAFAVACGELTLRFGGPSWLDARMRELDAGRDLLGETSAFAFIESSDGHFTNFRPGSTFVLADREFRIDVHITAWGTRVTGADAAGRDTIVFLGDSFAFGFGVDDVDTFVSRTCRARGAACLDAAFPGSTLSTQLDVVERRYALWGRPRRLVFVFFAGNDVAELVADAQSRSARPPAERPGDRALRTANAAIHSPLLRRSYVAQLAKASARAALLPNAMDPMFVTAAGAHGAFAGQAAAALDAALARLDTLSARLGFGASFVLIPDRFQLYPAAMADRARYYGLDPERLDMRFPQRLLGERLGRRGIPSLDVLPCLDPADAALYYRSDNHLTAHGHDVVARCILKSTTIPI